MSLQIIKQPNDKYCIFSSIVDNVIAENMKPEEIIEFLVAKSRRDIEESVRDIIFRLENGGKPYYQFTMTYEQMQKLIKEIHGT